MNQNGGSRTETLVKLVLIFVISLLSFSVGTFVGKQFSDSQYQMANLEREASGDRKTASITAKNEDTLSDEDIANLTQEFVNAEREANKNSQMPVADKDPMESMAEKVAAAAKETEQPTEKKEATKVRNIASHQPTNKKPDAVTKAADRIAADLSPSPSIDKKKRIPNALPALTAASTIGKYTVQVASYSTQEEAAGHAQKLKDAGFEAFSLAAQVRGKTWHRVSVGLFGTRSSAKSYREKLLQQDKVSTAIVQKIVQ